MSDELLRHISRFEIEIEVVHDEDPEYFGELLMADLNHALRCRGCDDGQVTSISWRDPTIPIATAGLWIARGRVGGDQVDHRVEWRPVSQRSDGR